MTRWFSLHQLDAESSDDGRFERVVDGRHRGMKGWLRFTFFYASIIFVIWLALVIVVNLFFSGRP